MPKIYAECIEDIRRHVGDNYIYFILDETPDIKFRAVVNVLVGVLNGTYSKPYLLMVRFFNTSVDSQIMGQVIIDATVKLWPNGIKFEKVQLVITDAAAYIKKAFSNTLFPHMIHITCLAHAIHSVCEHIRDHAGRSTVSWPKLKVHCETAVDVRCNSLKRSDTCHQNL